MVESMQFIAHYIIAHMGCFEYLFSHVLLCTSQHITTHQNKSQHSITHHNTADLPLTKPAEVCSSNVACTYVRKLLMYTREIIIIIIIHNIFICNCNRFICNNNKKYNCLKLIISLISRYFGCNSSYRR